MLASIEHFTMCILVLLLLNTPEVLCTLHSIIGEAPVFQSQPDSVVVVSSDVFTTVNGVSANLVLPCKVTGDPTPGVTWFREDTAIAARFVMSDGTLVLNVTFNVDASRAGVRYHCSATNILGSFNATARSRLSLVIYAYFDGFESRTVGIIPIQTVGDGAVSLECDYRPAIPIPVIQWFMNSETNPVQVNIGIRYVDNRYLFIKSLTVAQRNSQFYCVVANAYLGTNPQRSPTTYSLSSDIPADQLITYAQLESYTVELGSTLDVQHAIAYRGSDTMVILSPICWTVPPVVYLGNGLTGIIYGHETPGDYEHSCAIQGVSDTLTLQIQVKEGASVTHPTSDVIDREHLVGMGIVYTCENQGLPIPTVNWYYNGAAIFPEGIAVNGSELAISSLQVKHSGIYQCVVKNTVKDKVKEDSRSWVLEVRIPTAPTIQPLIMTNDMAVEDQLLGTLIVAHSGTANLVITIIVTSDPCPTVQWRLDGVVITADANYIFGTPCGASEAVSPFMLTLTIGNHTLATSGEYSATVANSAGSTAASIHVTVPVAVTVSSLSVEVEMTGEQQPACLLEGSDVIMTCDIVGFPRPVIRFRKDSQVITPGEGDFCTRLTSISFDQIRIHSVRMYDKGEYSCEAETGDGTIIQLTPSPSSQTVCNLPEARIFHLPSIPFAGGELEFYCHVTGSPYPQIAWLKDSVVLSNTNNINISSNNARLSIAVLATQDDSGEYVCVATNYAGSVNGSIQIEVQADSCLVISTVLFLSFSIYALFMLPAG